MINKLLAGDVVEKVRAQHSMKPKHSGTHIGLFHALLYLSPNPILGPDLLTGKDRWTRLRDSSSKGSPVALIYSRLGVDHSCAVDHSARDRPRPRCSAAIVQPIRLLEIE